MRLPTVLRRRLLRWATGVMARRDPDQVIGAATAPYLERWWLVPRNPFLNLYLHRIHRSDADRALHDHPWVNATAILNGRYREWTAKRGGPRAAHRAAGDLVLRPARRAHRLELIGGRGAGDAPAVVTLFLTGPRLRAWGFWCPGPDGRPRWVHWRVFAPPPHGQAKSRNSAARVPRGAKRTRGTRRGGV